MFSLLTRRTLALYVRIKPDWLSVRAVSKNTQPSEYEDVPLIAIEGELQAHGYVKLGKILAVGQGASKIPKALNSITLLLNGFEHPRSIISNFEVAELTLKYFIKKACEGQNHFHQPRVVMHPLDKLEGGLTQIEAKALSDLAVQAGAGEVYLYSEPDSLSDDNILSIHKNEKALKITSNLKK